MQSTPPGSAVCAVQGKHGPAYQGEDEQPDPASLAAPGQLAGSVESRLSEALMSTPSPFALMDVVTPIAFAGISVPSVGLL